MDSNGLGGKWAKTSFDSSRNGHRRAPTPTPWQRERPRWRRGPDIPRQLLPDCTWREPQPLPWELKGIRPLKKSWGKPQKSHGSYWFIIRRAPHGNYIKYLYVYITASFQIQQFWPKARTQEPTSHRQLLMPLDTWKQDKKYLKKVKNSEWTIENT